MAGSEIADDIMNQKVPLCKVCNVPQAPTATSKSGKKKGKKKKDGWDSDESDEPDLPLYPPGIMKASVRVDVSICTHRRLTRVRHSLILRSSARSWMMHSSSPLWRTGTRST